MDLLWFSVALIGTFAALVLAVHLLMSAPRQRNAWLLAIVCFAAAGARVLGWHEYSFWISQPYRIELGSTVHALDLVRNLSPGMFMLLCHSMFQDAARVPRMLLFAFAAQILLEHPQRLLLGIDARPQWHWLEITPAILQLFLLGCGIYWLIAGWRADLVDKRRQIRWVFLVVVGTHVFLAVLIQRLLVPWESIASFHWYLASSVLATALAVFALFGVLRFGVTRYIDPFMSSDRGLPAVQDDPDLAALKCALNERHLYRENGLTIGALAAQLRIPEYRLRKLIHEQLGFRNFNALLHHYRIEEACAWLRDPRRKDSPVLTIALSVGYSSINPFNRAFKELKGMTPTAFRSFSDPAGPSASQHSHVNS